MQASEAIVAALSHSTSRKITGRKRLQKIIFLLKESGVDIDVKFYLHQFGPFSGAVAEACDFLTVTGQVSESEETWGSTGYFLSSYSLNSQASPREPSDEKVQRLIRMLEPYKTVILEIASTLLFFLRSGDPREVAIRKTKTMKPSKSSEATLQQSNNLLLALGLVT